MERNASYDTLDEIKGENWQNIPPSGTGMTARSHTNQY